MGRQEEHSIRSLRERGETLSNRQSAAEKDE